MCLIKEFNLIHDKISIQLDTYFINYRTIERIIKNREKDFEL